MQRLMVCLVLGGAFAESAAAQSAADIALRDRNASIDACVARGGSPLICKRDAAQVRLDTVKVFADRAPDAAGSSSILLSGVIEDIHADHPAEVLNTLPGVNIHLNSGQEHLIAIRSPVLTAGAGQGSFLILENGVPTRSPAFGNVNSLIEPHFETANAIEVIRGPGSAKYGSNAVHGLVNVLLSPPKERMAQVQVSASSIGRTKADLILDQGYLARAALSLQSDTGWRDATGLFQAKASGTVETVLAGWTITAFGGASYLEQETADFLEGTKAYRDKDARTTNDDPSAYRDAWSVRGAVRLGRDLGGGTLSLTPFLRVQQMDFRQHFLPYAGLEKNGHTGGGLMARYELGLADSIVWRIGSDVDVASGYLRETQSLPTFGFNPANDQFPQGVHYDYTVDTAMGALWSELDWSLSERLSLLLGLRGETHSYDYTTRAPVGRNGRFNVPADRNDTFSFATPKLGLVYALTTDLDLYTTYARGARAPQASDLYRLQDRQSVGEIDVETLDSFEAGLRGTAFGGDLVFDLAAYSMAKDEFFFRDSDGRNVVDGKTRHRGLEAAGDWRLSDTWALRGALSFADHTYAFDRVVASGAETIRDGNTVDTAPDWLADLTLIWTPTDRAELALSAEQVGAYFTNPANTRDYPGHTVVRLRGAYQVNDSLEVFAIVRNLFDVEYADRADFGFGVDRYFPGEPRSLTLGIRKRFEGDRP